MQVRIPPIGGAGVPIGELVLLFSLLSINYAKLLPKLFSLVFVYPFLVWWGLGITRAFMGVPEYGLWSLRDATHVLESLFIVTGFAFAANLEMIERFFRFLPKTLAVVVVYALGYPFAGVLESISPTIVAGNGLKIPIFFQYAGTSNVAVMAAAYVLIFQQEIRVFIIHNYPTAIAAAIWGYIAALFQNRTLYVQIAAVLILFALYRRQLLSRGILAIVLLLGAVALIPVLGLHIKGRLGEEVSLSFVIDHILAIGGASSDAAGAGIEGAAAGVELRHGWWISIYHRLTTDIWHLLFGLGYGFALTNFHGSDGALVREPHNSYVSIVARLGLVGGIAWVWLQVLMVRVWHSGYRQCVRMGWHKGQNRLLILMVFFIVIWVLAMGEDGFEKPYNTIPYYFFWGVALRYVLHIKNGIAGPTGDGKQ
jgi:hypothetical protein